MSDKSFGGNFLWYDLGTTDLEAAQAFYTAVTGWNLVPHNDQYTMFANAQGPIGGSMVLSDDAKAMGAPPHWLAYIGTPDLDATVAKLQGLGGKVYVPAFDMPNVGRIAVAADPFGAAFGLFQPAEGGQAPGEAKVGDFSWNELMTDNVDTVWGFYQNLFGWTPGEAMDMGEMGVYFLFEASGISRGGIMKRPPEMPVSAWLHYIRVEDLDAALATTTKLGGTIMNGPMAVPGGERVAQCMDPQGAAFALHGI